MRDELGALSHEQWTQLYNELDAESQFLVFLQRVLDGDTSAPRGSPAVGSLVGHHQNDSDAYELDGADDGDAIVLEYLPDGRALLCAADGRYIAAEV